MCTIAQLKNFQAHRVIAANGAYIAIMQNIKETVDAFENCNLFVVNPDATSTDLSSRGFYLKLIETAHNHCLALTAYQMVKQSNNPKFVTQMVNAERVLQSFRSKAKTHYI